MVNWLERSSVGRSTGRLLCLGAWLALVQLEWVAGWCFSVAADEPADIAQRVEAEALFQERIEPLLVTRCYGCHSQRAAQFEGGLRVDSADGLLTGGESGPAITPGDPIESLLVQRITSDDAPMPPDEPLIAAEIDDIKKWIAAGAPDSRTDSDQALIRDPEYEAARDYWAFQPLRNAVLPAIDSVDGWSRTTIDQFILAQLRQVGLRPAETADPATLVRRLYFDLTGLPPTPEQVAAFVEDPSEPAYLAIVESLLASPQYGERAAQYWLDVVRYAETEGFEYDRPLPDIWRYRDYVIESFNQDKPYDQFLTEQLAGDELDPANPILRIAAGFHRLGPVRRNAGNQLVASSRNEVLTERTDIIGSAFLGLTIGCARCHDHKFDPIPQQDYYRLQAFLAATQEDNVSLLDPEEQSSRTALTGSLTAQIEKLKQELRDLTGEAAEQIRQQIEQLEEQMPSAGPTLCSVKNDLAQSEAIRLLKRGNPELPGPQVGMRVPGVLLRDARAELPQDIANPRSRLAAELTGPLSPLTARVIVNRIWQQHFSTGLVSTANDFGRNGAQPSHPELLEYLAQRFVASGWRFKELHREIVTSTAYRQSSRPIDPRAQQELDPTNRWLAVFPRRRLSGEEIRDAMLQISGALNPEPGGPSVVIPVEQELIDQLYKPSQWMITPDVSEHNRRSIYLFAKRNLRLPFLEVFDQPSAQTSCAARQQSTHARQALEMINGDFANRLAAVFSDRLRREAGQASEAQVRLGYRLAASREPTPLELQLSTKFINEVGLPEFALALFNVNAFLYVD